MNAQEIQLDRQWLEFFPIIIDMFTTTNMQYRAFIASANREYDLIIKNHHARAISRIGFTAQDMMDFQEDVTSAIQNRGIEINNNNAQCILDAHQELNSSVELAGDVFDSVSREWFEEVNILVR